MCVDLNLMAQISIFAKQESYIEAQLNNDISIQLKLLVCCYAMQSLSVAAAIFCNLALSSGKKSNFGMMSTNSFCLVDIAQTRRIS